MTVVKDTLMPRPVRKEETKTAVGRPKIKLVDAATGYMLLKIVFITPKVVEVTMRLIYNWRLNKAIAIEGDIVPTDLTEKGLLEYYVTYISTIMDHAIDELDLYSDLLEQQYPDDLEIDVTLVQDDVCACDIGGKRVLPDPVDDNEQLLLSTGYSVV